MTEQQIPDGYMKDAQGRLVPIDMVREIDRLRDALVKDTVERAKLLSEHIKTFKSATMGDISAFVELSAERFGVKLGGDKGNVTLTSYDGRYKLTRDMDDFITFDEGLQAAKALIDQCIRTWAEGTPAGLRALVTDVFQVDKRGRVNTKRILSLRRINIQDETWQRAMQAIADSTQVTSSKAYIRIYERQDNGQYVQISLDVAA